MVGEGLEFRVRGTGGGGVWGLRGAFGELAAAFLGLVADELEGDCAGFGGQGCAGALDEGGLVAAVAVDSGLDGDEGVVVFDQVRGDECAWCADVPVHVRGGADDYQTVARRGGCFVEMGDCVVEEVVRAG